MLNEKTDTSLETAKDEFRKNLHLITLAFMERLEAVKTSFDTNKIKCSFFDNTIMFAIRTKKDLFEIGSLFKPFRHSSCMDVFRKEITSILDMIDHFKLAEKTGL